MEKGEKIAAKALSFGGAVHWVSGVAHTSSAVHRATKPYFINNPIKFPKFLKPSNVQVSQALFLASEGVFLKAYGGCVKENPNTNILQFLKSHCLGLCTCHFAAFYHSPTFHSSIYFLSLSTHSLTPIFSHTYPQFPFSQTLVKIPKL